MAEQPDNRMASRLEAMEQSLREMWDHINRQANTRREVDRNSSEIVGLWSFVRRIEGEEGGGTGGLMWVTLSRDGGDDGNQSSAPDYTYTATGLDGTELGTTLTPLVGRPAGAAVAASYGIGYANTAGTFVLGHAFEIPRTVPCNEQPT